MFGGAFSKCFDERDDIFGLRFFILTKCDAYHMRPRFYKSYDCFESMYLLV